MPVVADLFVGAPAPSDRPFHMGDPEPSSGSSDSDPGERVSDRVRDDAPMRELEPNETTTSDPLPRRTTPTSDARAS